MSFTLKMLLSCVLTKIVEKVSFIGEMKRTCFNYIVFHNSILCYFHNVKSILRKKKIIFKDLYNIEKCQFQIEYNSKESKAMFSLLICSNNQQFENKITK